MNAEDQTFVIVGAGLAGAKAAETLRSEGFDGRVVLIGDEPERPYERPPLSKDYLRGETDEKPYVHEQSFYAEQRDRALDLDPGHRYRHRPAGALLEGDRRLGYDRLLWPPAPSPPPRRPGRRARRNPLPAHPRRLGADRRSGSSAGQRLVVVGSGWIGAEVAASARQKGCEVTMLEMASLPLERVLGPELGQIYLDLHRDHGVEFLPETTVERFEGQASVERVITLTTPRSRPTSSSSASASLLAPAWSRRPGSGSTTASSSTSSSRTSVPGVFAAGDVANAHHPFYGATSGSSTGPTRSIRAPSPPGHARPGGGLRRIPYFFSDQYETGMEYSGHATDWDEVVFRGDVAAREFIAFWLKDERVVAGHEHERLGRQRPDPRADSLAPCG